MSYLSILTYQFTSFQIKGMQERMDGALMNGFCIDKIIP